MSYTSHHNSVKINFMSRKDQQVVAAWPRGAARTSASSRKDKQSRGGRAAPRVSDAGVLGGRQAHRGLGHGRVVRHIRRRRQGRTSRAVAAEHRFACTCLLEAGSTRVADGETNGKFRVSRITNYPHFPQVIPGLISD